MRKCSLNSIQTPESQDKIDLAKQRTTDALQRVKQGLSEAKAAISVMTSPSSETRNVHNEKLKRIYDSFLTELDVSYRTRCDLARNNSEVLNLDKEKHEHISVVNALLDDAKVCLAALAPPATSHGYAAPQLYKGGYAVVRFHTL